MVQMMLKPETAPVFADREKDAEAKEMRYGLWQTLAWFAGLLLATSVFGFIIALAGFLLLFFHFRAKVAPLQVIVLSVMGVGFIMFMAWLLNRDFPPGLLQPSQRYLATWIDVMSQTGIPFFFMRGGSSRGPYMRREDLPQDRDLLAEVLDCRWFRPSAQYRWDRWR